VLGLADQYSLGACDECLTGRVRSKKDWDAAIIWRTFEETPTSHGLRPELPPEIDQVFGRCWPAPGRALRSCREFVEAARIALGIFGSGTESSVAYGRRAPGRRPGPRPGRQASKRPDSSPGAH